ncbi:hypothetical protein GGR50DRAFT_641167 [Xylaria sp. CBS 124048]|nr:hypothetical protein GGR50DRAFT_641167 [Xylaria sp. CBS 124048]
MATLVCLPDELLHQILRQISPEQTLESIALVSWRFHRLAEQRLLWKYYCMTSFKYWHSSHGFGEKVRGRLHDVDWKALYLLRLRRNCHVASLMDEIIASRLLRVEKIEQICHYGFDAKDYLWAQSQVDDTAPDSLARRYYSCAVLSSIHRSLAVQEWAKFQEHFRSASHFSDVQRRSCGMMLERALGAFDMFMLRNKEGDLDEISAILDDMAARFRTAYPRLHRATTRAKAIALAQWLHTGNMAGPNATEETMYDLRHCLIGRALRDGQHLPLPLVSAAIYSALALRSGFEAYPSAPVYSRTHVIIFSRLGVSLDGTQFPPEKAEHQETMFLEPSRSPDEVPIERVKYMLTELGIHSGHKDFLTPASPDSVIFKTAENVKSSFTTFRAFNRPISQPTPIVDLNRRDWLHNLQHALYSASWATVMMPTAQPNHDAVRWGWKRSVHQLLAHVLEFFPEDAWLIKKYIYPMYDAFLSPLRPGPNQEPPTQHIRNQLRDLQRADGMIEPPRRRSDLPEGVHVRYRIGQVFRHRRYDYHGIILGWWIDGAGSGSGSGSGSGWNRLPTLSRRESKQIYYHCMVASDGSDQHVIAERSIEVLKLRGGLEVLPEDLRDLIPMAGKFFKRWDGEKGVFVSNVREIYPED